MSDLVRIRTVLLSAVLLVAAALVVPTPASAAGTTDVWIGSLANSGGDNHSWTDPNNWSTRHVPATGDSVVIAPPDETLCYAHVDGVPSGVRLTDFTLREAAFTSTGTCLASIDGGSISVSGTFSWSAGDLNTATTLLPTSTGTVTPNPNVPDTSRLGANLTVHSTLVLDGNVESDSADQRLAINAGDSLVIASDGDLDANDSNEISGLSCCTNPPRVTNHGLLTVNGGRLDLSAVEFDQDAQLDTTGQGQVRTTRSDNSTAATGATYTGDGSWLVGTASTTTFAGTQTLGADFHMILGGDSDSGDDNYRGTFTFAGTGTFDWDGGEISAALTISHGISVDAAGAVSGSDERNVDGGASSRLAITNHGTITFSAGAGYFASSGGRINNAADGTIALGAATAIDHGVIANQGLVRVPAGADTSPVVLSDVSYLDQSGTTDVEATQTLRVDSGTTTNLSTDTITGGGLFDVEAPTTITTKTTVGSGTTFQHGYSTLGSNSAAVATIDGAGAFSWTGGSIVTSLTLAPTGGVTISGGTNKHIVERTPNKGGTVLITAPSTFAAGTSSSAPNELDIDCACHLNLAGATTAYRDVVISHGIVTNSGSFDVYAAKGHPTYLSAAGYTNTGTTTVHSGQLQSDNDFVISAGTVSTAAGGSIGVIGSSSSVRLTGGTLAGTGHVAGPLINSGGIVAPAGTAIGSLYLDGTYSQTKTATLSVDIAATRADRLVVSGTARLAGTVAANNTARYQPAAGATATVVTGSSVTGTLSCVVTSGTNATGTGARHWDGKPSGTSLVLTSLDGQKTTC